MSTFGERSVSLNEVDKIGACDIPAAGIEPLRGARGEESPPHTRSRASLGRGNRRRTRRRASSAPLPLGSRNPAVTPARHSAFIKQLTDSGIELDRKTLAELAARQPKAFSAIVAAAKPQK